MFPFELEFLKWIKTQFDWNEYFAALGRCFDAMK